MFQPPQAVEERVPIHDPPGELVQQPQDPHLPQRQIIRDLAPAGAELGGEDLEVGHGEGRGVGGAAGAQAAAGDGADAGHHLLDAEGLDDEVVAAQLQADHPIDLLGLGADEDDGDVGIAGADGAADVVAVRARHHDVEEHEVGRLGLVQAHRLLAVGGGDGLVALGREDVPQALPDVAIVFGEQDLHATSSVMRMTSKRAPCSAGRMRSSPPCRRARSRARPRPMPVPGTPSWLAVPSRTKGWNTRSRSVAGMPGPQSSTRMRVMGGAASVRTTTGPRGAYFSTLPKRLPRIWVRASTSTFTRPGAPASKRALTPQASKLGAN